jgi:putative IMPACT (imprinted ancient) family translation regulator
MTDTTVRVSNETTVKFKDLGSLDTYKAFINEDGELVIESEYSDEMVRIAKQDVEPFITAIDEMWAQS